MSPPKIKVRGAGRAKGIPAGYVLGRSSTGNGDVELLSITDLARSSPMAGVTQQIASSLDPVGANPTATASDTAVNGTALTFMRSDAAPAVQKGSTSQFGIVKVDGVTITAAGGVLSAVSGGGSTDGSIDAMLFGDGSDGDLTISSGVTTITRDMYYRNLTISGTGSLQNVTSGGNRAYSIFVSGTLDISAAPAGAIKAFKTDGTNANSSAAGAGGGGIVTGTVGGSATGGTGAAGAVGAGSIGSAGSSSNNLGGNCGASGAGGLGSGGAGGTSKAAPTYTAATDIRRLVQSLAAWTTGSFAMPSAGVSAPGGSSGGGDTTHAGGGGGGGGSGGATLYIAARTISRGASTAASAIQALGGNGGTGGTFPSGANQGGGGGGAGGGGGWIYLVFRTLAGATATNALDASGGTGGAGGNAQGTGLGGDAGGAGGGGRIDVYNLGAGTQSITAITSPVAGNAHSGVTGGTATAPTPQKVSL